LKGGLHPGMMMTGLLIPTRKKEIKIQMNGAKIIRIKKMSMWLPPFYSTLYNPTMP
jgi:hypothetical protein